MRRPHRRREDDRVASVRLVEQAVDVGIRNDGPGGVVEDHMGGLRVEKFGFVLKGKASKTTNSASFPVTSNAR